MIFKNITTFFSVFYFFIFFFRVSAVFTMHYQMRYFGFLLKQNNSKEVFHMIQLVWPITGWCCFSIPPENIRKLTHSFSWQYKFLLFRPLYHIPMYVILLSHLDCWSFSCYFSWTLGSLLKCGQLKSFL